MRENKQSALISVFKSINLHLWLVFLTGILLVIGLGNLPIRAQVGGIPAVVSSCIPKQTRQPIVRSEVVGSTRLQGKDYYLLGTYTQNSQQPIDLLVSVTSGNCQQLFFNPMGDAIPFVQVIPQSAAQQLTLARYRRQIQRIGRNVFEQQIKQFFNSTKNLNLFAEETWALQQLGIILPTKA